MELNKGGLTMNKAKQISMIDMLSALNPTRLSMGPSTVSEYGLITLKRDVSV